MIHRAIILLLFIIAFTRSSEAQYLYLDSTLTISTATTFDSVRVVSGGTLIADDSIAVLGNMTIESGGIVTHSDRILTGLRLNVLGRLDIQAGGKVDVTARGLRGGWRGSIYGQYGEAYNEAGTDIVQGAGTGRHGAGGSYGGWGGNGDNTANTPYGLLEDPKHLGSGGACGDLGAQGGNGGGRMLIVAGSCIVNGSILANGGVGTWYNESAGGGGSGGSIKLIVGALSGTGTIEANGGNGGGQYAGAGGGGRIAIYYTSNNFPDSNLSVAGGTGGNPGQIGTVFISKNKGDIITHSFAKDRLILFPTGDPPFTVFLRDSNNLPIVGANDVWLDFSGVSGLVTCPSEQLPNQVIAPWPSDSLGRLFFYVKAGGCSSDMVKVKSPNGVIAEVPIKSMDHNASFLVTPADFVGDPCNDYNNDGIVDAKDFAWIRYYLNQSCTINLTDFIPSKIVTTPTPDHIYMGDTVDVCARLYNTLSEEVLIDSVVYYSAGFGIGCGWTRFAEAYNIILGPQDSVNISNQFVINTPQHGCFKISYYVRFNTLSNKIISPRVTLRGDPPNILCKVVCSDGSCDPYAPCPPPPPPGFSNCNPSVLGTLAKINTNDCSWGRDNQLNIDPKPRPVGLLKSKAQSVTSTGVYTSSVPIGNAFGDSLNLYYYADLPEGWSCQVSDSGWIHTPDTIAVSIHHDSLVRCNEEARVMFYAYTSSDQFAGNADVTFYLFGTRGDLNGDDTIDNVDLSDMKSYLYQFGPEPAELGTAELNGDVRIDIADITRLVDYLFVSNAPLDCVIDTGYVGPEISIATSYLNDTTTIFLTSPIDLKGLQLELIGRKNVIPENLLGDSLGIAFGALDSLYRIGLFDLSGGAVIKSGARNVIRIPGAITILSSRASDKDHHSLPITTSRALDYDMRSGWNLLSIPIVSYYVRSNDLFPSATSSAFTYQNQYVEKDTLKHGIGYWLKFGANEGHVVLGFPISLDTINVLSGWNMIGSVSEPIPVSNITSIPGGRITSDFFGYTDQYRTYDTIYPGRGYWIRVNQDCQLILSSATQLLSKGRIKIVPTSEMPPAPPSDIAGRIELPKEYRLEQNYPNPFNPITTIKYGLPLSSNVKLRIFNVLGQVVTTLKDEEESAGYKQIKWNSSAVASGIYFYRLEATSVSDPSKSFTQVKKMLLLK